MIRKLLLTLAVLVLITGAAAYLYLETAVRSRIETAASSALGTQVSVSGVILSPFSGKGSVRELKVANPEGFSTPYAIELGSLDFEVDLDTVFADVIQITSIIVREARISYETRLITDNIRTLIDNIPAREAESTPIDSPARKRVIIRDFQMIDPRINVFALVGSAPIALPNIQIENIGESNAPATIPEASREILGALYRSLLFAGIPSLALLGEGVGEQIKEGAGRAAEALRDIADSIQGLFSN
ncbi:MAG: hypothetical protein WBJ75_09450 [Pseudohongiellaceae bacterium]